jgi:hypothetical protein
MSISKNSFNRGLMRIALVIGILFSILGFLISYSILDFNNFRIIYSLVVSFIILFGVLILFKLLSWILSGFFD